MNFRIVIGIIAMMAVFFGSWLFAWPIVESWYIAGVDWTGYIMENYMLIPYKLMLFSIGALLFVGGAYAGIKVVIMK